MALCAHDWILWHSLCNGHLSMAFCIALPRHTLGFWHGELLWLAADVGPSAGYNGCLGLAIATIVGDRRAYVVTFVLSALFLQFFWATIRVPEQGHLMSSNLAHLIAFPLGLAVARWMKPHFSRGRSAAFVAGKSGNRIIGWQIYATRLAGPPFSVR